MKIDIQTAKREKCWKELVNSLKGNFSTYDLLGKKGRVKVQVFEHDKVEKLPFEVSILFEGGVKNEYEVEGFEREEGDKWRWELFLCRDGTWTIK